MQISKNSPRKTLVTGATGDIGFAVAKKAIEEGCEVVISARDANRLSQTTDLLASTAVTAIPADISIPGECEMLVNQANSVMSGIDSVIHCAGIQNTSLLRNKTLEQFKITMYTNFQSALFITKAFSNKRIAKVNPSIVFVSSVAAIKGHSGESLYAASKAALISAARSLSRELATQGIRINTVAPGAVIGTMTNKIHEKVGDEAFNYLISNHPLGLGTPDNVADAILFLASAKSGWITGQTLVVDGGYTS
jgi:NAD(P)-dependent dehydrogenase (short-subunit alcohol dehydrogenase family)